MEEQSEEQKKVLEQAYAVKEQSELQLQDQIKTEAAEKSQQAIDAAQDIKDKINQELAKIPQKIEDDLDEFNNKLKTMMNKNISPKVNVNSPEFDLDVAMGDFKKILNPLIGAISPVESVVGKVPVIGDIMGALTKFTSNNDNGGLTKEEIKKLVPNKPEVPQTLLNKIDETCRTVQEFCVKLPTILIDVLIQMLVAIYNMFDQIVGIIGVPPPVFPFSLIKAFPTLIPKVQDFVTNAPSQIKDIVMGAIKEKFAAAQALSIPKVPEPSDVAKAAKANAESSINKAQGQSAPKQTSESPIESPVIPTNVVQATPPEQISELTWDQVKEKWSERFHDEYNFKKDDITKMIECYKVMYNGSGDVINYYRIGSGSTPTKKQGTKIRSEATPNQCDKWMLSQYNSILQNDPILSYDRTYKASTIYNDASVFGIKSSDTGLKSELKALGDNIVAAGYVMIYPEKKIFGIF